MAIPNLKPKETDMPKLTGKIALELATRIEGLKEQISAVYREANEYDGVNNSNVIRDIVKAREEAADLTVEWEGLVAALDLPDDDE